MELAKRANLKAKHANRANRAGLGTPFDLHRFEAVGVKPANRQFVSAAPQGEAEFAGVVSRDRFHGQGLHHGAPVDLVQKMPRISPMGSQLPAKSNRWLAAS